MYFFRYELFGKAYVLDFAAEALKRECGVCVMVSRGCMGTPVRGSGMKLFVHEVREATTLR